VGLVGYDHTRVRGDVFDDTESLFDVTDFLGLKSEDWFGLMQGLVL
jgi:hypothetical protein